MKPTLARRIGLPFLLLAMAACACTRHSQATSADQQGEVEVDVVSIGMDHDSGSHFVLLEDRKGKRGVPIVIGDNEAEAIAIEMHGLKAPRPLTQDLMRNIIEQTGNHVDRVIITAMRDDIYLAQIVLDGGRHMVDSRPSDAIALAMGTHAPIFVNQKLLAPTGELGSDVTDTLPKNDRGLGIAVQELTPNLARYFDVPPSSAVLVDEVGPKATAAGIARGDLVTTIDGKAVTGVADFDREVATLKEGAPVVLKVRRGSAVESITLKP